MKIVNKFLYFFDPIYWEKRAMVNVKKWDVHRNINFPLISVVGNFLMVNMSMQRLEGVEIR